MESGVAERESDVPAPQVQATVNQPETKATKPLQAVALRSWALEQPSVAQAAPWEPGAALQPVDESAPCQ